MSFDVFQLTSGCGVVRTKVCAASQLVNFAPEDIMRTSEAISRIGGRTEGWQKDGSMYGRSGARETVTLDLRLLYEREFLK